MADLTSVASTMGESESTPTANRSDASQIGVSLSTRTANSSAVSEVGLSYMTGAIYQAAEFVIARRNPLLYRSGAYSRQVPSPHRFIP